MENELLILSKEFKQKIKEKNVLISKLKKIILVCYGLVVVTDEVQDLTLIEEVRRRLSMSLNEYFDVESDTEEDDMLE